MLMSPELKQFSMLPIYLLITTLYTCIVTSIQLERCFVSGPIDQELCTYPEVNTVQSEHIVCSSDYLQRFVYTFPADLLHCGIYGRLECQAPMSILGEPRIDHRCKNEVAHIYTEANHTCTLYNGTGSGSGLCWQMYVYFDIGCGQQNVSVIPLYGWNKNANTEHLCIYVRHSQPAPESSSALVSTSSMTTPPGSVSPTMTSSVATLSKVHSTTTTTKRPLMSLSSGVGGTVSISLLSHQLSVSSVVTKTSESSSCLPSVVGLTTTAINSEVAGRTSSLNSLKLTVVSIILGLVALCLLLVTLILGVVICKQRSKQKYPLKLGLQEREQNPTLQGQFVNPQFSEVDYKLKDQS